jgi:hypothetical protein
MKYTKEFILSKMKPSFVPQIPPELSSFTSLKKAWIHFSNGASISIVEEMDSSGFGLFSSKLNDENPIEYEFMMNSSFQNIYIPVSFNNEEINDFYGEPHRYCSLETVIAFLNLVENEAPIVEQKYQNIHAQLQKTYQFIENRQEHEFINDLPNLDKALQEFVKTLNKKELIHNFFHQEFEDKFKGMKNIKKQIFYANLAMKAIENDSLNLLNPILSKINPDLSIFIFNYFVEKQGINERLSNNVLQTPNIELFQLLKEKNIYDVTHYVEVLKQQFPVLSEQAWFEKLTLEFSIEEKIQKKSKNKL